MLGHQGAVTLASIPAPPTDMLQLGHFHLRFYAVFILLGIAVATVLTMRRWRAQGGPADLVLDVALWGVVAGLVGARLYHVATSWDEVPKVWWGAFAVWEGGLSVLGGVLFGALAGAWVVRRRGASVGGFADAAAPGILLAAGIGRIGCYFNQELFGKPTDLPWALAVDPAFRPAGYEGYSTFHPTFLYELLWNVAFALVLVWAGRRFRLRPGGLAALAVAAYSFGRIWEELLRIDPSLRFFGLRLNFYVATVLFLASAAFFLRWQRERRSEVPPRALVDRGVPGL